jgi:crotonobetainyl-CoA:carnitine CoA-transferase CaiB-like acyl-CoA transferase
MAEAGAARAGEGAPVALAGMRVLEVGDGLGVAYCGKLLADLGADVVKVEPPDGDPARRSGPFPQGRPDAERSGLFLYLNTNKRGISLGVDTPAGRGRLARLVEDFDVLVTGLAPARLVALGLRHEDLAPRHPGLIVAAITPYGLDGPYRDWRAYDFNTADLGGLTSRIGDPAREPLKLPLSQGGIQAGLVAAIAILAAAWARANDGGGEGLDVAEAEVWATLHTGFGVTRYLVDGRVEGRSRHRFLNHPYPHTVLPCRDGHVALQCAERRQWQRLVELLGNPAWAADPRYQDRVKNNHEYADELDALLAPWLARHTREEIFAACRERRIPAAPIKRVDEVVADPHLAARGFFETVAHPVAGPVRQPGFPYRLSATPARVRRAAPLLGEHTADLLGEAPGPPAERATASSRAGSSAEASAGAAEGRAPLQGIRVMDLGWVWAGAIPGQVLADLGAEVIKVESRVRLDYMRQGRPIRGTTPDPEQNPMFHAVNRNKLSLTVDLRHPGAPPLVRRLAARSDVVIENFAPGFLAKRGLDYQALREARPDLIMLSVSMAGQTGPLRDLRGYATIIAALSGLDGLVGYPGEAPIGMQQPYSDPNGSLHGLVAVLAALHHRRRTGQGQHIDLSMWEAAVAVMGEAVMEYTLAGRVAGPQGNRHPAMAPHGHYPAAEPDRWLSIVVGSEEEWRALRRAMGEPAWAARPEFADAPARLQNQAELDARLAEWTRRHPQRALVERLQRAGVAAAPVLGPAERAIDPHFVARGTYARVDHPVLGEEWIYTLPWKMRRRPSVLGRAPLLGEQNAYVLGALLGLSAEEMAGLVERGVVA